jgi:peptide/nickel transport system permease protein
MSTDVDHGVAERTGRSYVDRLRSSTFLRKLLSNRLAIVGIVIILGIALAAVYARLTMSLDTLTQTQLGKNPSLASPSASHPFGTDLLGRDVFKRVLYGASYALKFGTVTVLASTTLGVALGVTAAYSNDVVDNVIMRTMDVLLAFPSLLLALALIAILGNGLWQAALALTIVYTPRFARVVRGAGLKVSEEEYIEATKAVGASDRRIVFLHVLPNCLAPITVQSTLNFGLAILNLAGLSFLGFGPSAGMPSWGLMLSNGVNNGLLTGEWWWSFFPGLFLAITVLGFNLLGDAMRDALDPRMRETVE